eukprot:11945_1
MAFISFLRQYSLPDTVIDSNSEQQKVYTDSKQYTLDGGILFCNGYVRKQERILQLSNIIPASIITMIYNYQIPNWKFISTPEHQEFIKNNGRAVVMKERNGYGCVNAFHSVGFDSDIHQFKIKVIAYESYSHAKHKIAFGITTFKNISDEYIGKNKGTHYYYKCSGQIVGAGGEGIAATKWNFDDIITMTLDCKKWILSYCINAETYTMNIKKDRTYFVCLSLDDGDAIFAIV